jgi:hypothetical protein
MTIRALFAIATKYGCKLKAGDIETAFLSANMDCEVWVKMPPYWGHGDAPITGELNENLPPRLKGVPGIPQGSRLFYENFSAHLQTMGWKPSAADKCLFLSVSNAELTAVIIWVDDFIFMCQSEQTWEQFLKSLRKRFTVPAADDLVTFLGMDVVFNPTAHTMFISQLNAINTLLERANMMDCNTVSTPCQAGVVWTKKDCPEKQASADICTQYRALVALANFIANWTRPDITFTVNKLCKYMSNPGPAHWQALKHLLRYLKGTQNVGLAYRFNEAASSQVQGLHGELRMLTAPTPARVQLPYVLFYGGAILSWFSKLHTYVTTCTNHSEYAALAAGAKEAQWLVFLFEELERQVKHTPVPIFVDNSGVISLVFNPVDHQSNKHVRLSCHYARELTDLQVIAPQRVATDKNLADVFTKSLGGVLFKAMVSSFVKAESDVSSVRGEVLANSQTDSPSPSKSSASLLHLPYITLCLSCPYVPLAF